MKKVIVTGATGMIGSTLIDLLITKGIEVTAIVRPKSNKIANIPKSELVNVIECEVENIKEMTGVLSSDYDVFYHFAWDGTYGDMRDNLFLQQKNVEYSMDAVKLAKECGCEVFVGAGSQAEFGFVDGILSNNTPKNPVTGYGVSKYNACMMTKLLCNQLGMRHNWGRILSVYGPKDNPYTLVMSTIIKMDNGEDVKCTPGNQIWDYLYSEDCSNAFYLIGEKGQNNKEYLVGSGTSKLLKEYITAIGEIVNPVIKIGFGEIPYYPNQVMKMTCDISDLLEDTGFEPKVEFSEGIIKTINWYRSEN